MPGLKGKISDFESKGITPANQLCYSKTRAIKSALKMGFILGSWNQRNSRFAIDKPVMPTHVFWGVEFRSGLNLDPYGPKPKHSGLRLQIFVYKESIFKK